MACAKGGRIKHHLKHNLWRQACQLIFIGYQAYGTLGRQLVDGANTVKLWHEDIHVAAKIHTVNGLSAHAGQEGLVNWFKHFKNQPKLALVHGETKPIKTLAKKIKKECGVKAIIPKIGTVIDLTKS